MSKGTSAERYDPLFVEAVAARLAMELGPVLQQSSVAVMGQLESAYQFHVRNARRLNAIEIGPSKTQTDEWELTRFSGV